MFAIGTVIVPVALKRVSDEKPGLTRKMTSLGFKYYYPDGRPVRDRALVKRINALAIPPAYTEVWISPDPNGHIQATGRDARGRKQYRYHPDWDHVRNATKYGRMLAFGKALPKIRKRVNALMKTGAPRERVLAAIVKLLEHTLIRVGNEEYARQNKSYGLTTLQNRHCTVSGNKILFGFRGKGGIHHNITVIDDELAEIVKHCQKLPGRDLFQYRTEEGKVHSVTSAEVNDFLREISGEDFSAKDFRTWAGSVYALSELRKLNGATGREAKKGVVAIIKAVAERLGNTPAVCKKSYIHPALLDAHTRGGSGVVAMNGHRGPRLDEMQFLKLLKNLNGQSKKRRETRSIAAGMTRA
jgi:DNA topoisomerase-1